MPRLSRARAFRLPFLIGVVLAWTLLAFMPVIRNDFVNWDDFRMFLDTTRSTAALGRIGSAALWASHRLGEYMPITWMSYGLDRSLWGDAASGYHLTSLLLHALTALAVMALARHFLRHALGPREGVHGSDVWIGATVAALTFAVHPLRVEAVAWVSARGTVLGGLFLVLAVLAYVVGWERGGRRSGSPRGGSRPRSGCSPRLCSRGPPASSCRWCCWCWTSTRSGGSAAGRAAG